MIRTQSSSIAPMPTQGFHATEIAVVGARAGFTIDLCGSLHVAYRNDEMAALEEFVERNHSLNSTIALLNSAQVAEKSSAVIQENLLGALWSSSETIIDPGEVVRKLPHFLHEEKEYDSQFRFNTVVTDIHYPDLVAGGKRWNADHIFVCSGVDFETLYPESFHDPTGITKVKLQRMRTDIQPNQFRIGVAFAAGLTLTHCGAFSNCPSLPTLKAQSQKVTPYFQVWGIHVMISQNSSGKLIIGDSHEYSLNPEPSNNSEINQCILNYLKTFVRILLFQIEEFWHGVYAKLTGNTELIAYPAVGVQ